MAGITTFLDESQMPNRTQEQKVFDNLLAYVFQNFPKWGREVNDTLGAMNALQAGGAYALPYIFDTATSDVDPGAGKLRLSSATQNAATVMRLDLTAGGQDYTTLLDTMDSSTSVIKGTIRLVKQGDHSKWMTFDVTARAAPSGYRNLTVVCTDSSSASPFVKDDLLLLFFQRSGDKGEIGVSGMVPLASVTIASAVASIDFLNIFSALYDKYTIEVQGLTNNGSPEVSLLQLAFGGVARTSGYTNVNVINAGSPSTGVMVGYSTQVTGVVEVRNVNGSLKMLESRMCDSALPGRLSIGTIATTTPASGFRIIPPPGFSFTSGVIRIYGNRNT
ncbi:hypothetical protein [Massilia sp. YIM B02443]|uniref:hypothetical protein n=1 Tax=Massilia sp. YIM B02443 TaxID=3050127 RepID=UPI0025B64D21|nr:hypothetical protein [Massilia sp. YIM B02443]MDN4036805.1 hypothetical protein [Massilia sp. YIM B02443]